MVLDPSFPLRVTNYDKESGMERIKRGFSDCKEWAFKRKGIGEPVKSPRKNQKFEA